MPLEQLYSMDDHTAGHHDSRHQQQRYIESKYSESDRRDLGLFSLNSCNCPNSNDSVSCSTLGS